MLFHILVSLRRGDIRDAEGSAQSGNERPSLVAFVVAGAAHEDFFIQMDQIVELELLRKQIRGSTRPNQFRYFDSVQAY